MPLLVPDLDTTPRLAAFVQAMDDLLARQPDEAELLTQADPLLAALVAHDDWLPDDFARADPTRYQQFLLHADPDGRFSVVSFVWGPSQFTPIHDHTVWGLIGLLRGEEHSQPYARDAQGHWVPQGERRTLRPGQVEKVSPTIGDVHRVSNALHDRPSISIHVYGANIGEVRRHVFLEDGTVKEFVSGYSNPVDDAQTDDARTADGTQAVTAAAAADEFPQLAPARIRALLLAREEICLLDVREEDPFAQAHPLFAANLPLGRIEVDAWRRLPRRSVPIAVYDDGEGLALPAARTLRRLGYSQVHLLAGGLQGWTAAGGEVFRDVNSASKAFGELVESQRHTPSLSAQEVRALLDARADVVVLDARRFDEYQTMSIPGGVSVPGAELVLRARALAPNARTRIIVNCAGRTRSIIGTQSLINAGIPNPVSALRNGTIGWTLAGQELAHGASARAPGIDEATRQKAHASARAVAYRAGVQRTRLDTVRDWLHDDARSTYLFDVRSPEEYAAGHLPGALSAPGGQLVQETDHHAAVRGARLVLCDDDGVRANMSASWLAQMGWEVHVIDGLAPEDFSEVGQPAPELPEPLAPVRAASVEQLKGWLNDRNSHTVVLDFDSSARFVAGHIQNAWWALRSRLAECLKTAHKGNRYVLSCTDGSVSRYAVAEVQALVKPGIDVLWLAGGKAAWVAAGHKLQAAERQLGCTRIDRYRRPYEGTDNAVEAMQGYLDWEFGLVAQLERDGAHHFRVI